MATTDTVLSNCGACPVCINKGRPWADTLRLVRRRRSEDNVEFHVMVCEAPGCGLQVPGDPPIPTRLE